MAEKSWLRDLIDRFLRWLRRAFLDGVQRIRAGARVNATERATPVASAGG